MPVSFAEATLGTTLTVPTLDEPGDPAGAARHAVGPDLPGQGPGRPGRQESGAGDLLVTVEVAVPSELTDEQRAAVEELAKVIEPPSRERRWGC